MRTLKSLMGGVEALVQRCSWKKCALRNFTKFTGICVRVSFLIKLQAHFFGLHKTFWGTTKKWACNFTKKETLTQVFSCDFCEISVNTFSQRTPPVVASGHLTNNWKRRVILDNDRKLLRPQHNSILP